MRFARFEESVEGGSSLSLTSFSSPVNFVVCFFFVCFHFLCVLVFFCFLGCFLRISVTKKTVTRIHKARTEPLWRASPFSVHVFSISKAGSIREPVPQCYDSTQPGVGNFTEDRPGTAPRAQR